MGVFQVLFVVMTIAFPTWLWTRTTTEKIKTDWTVFEKNLARVVESDQGFPGCSTLKAVDVFRELCENSLKREREGEALAVERAGSNIVFSCLYAKENINVSWRLEENKEFSMDCKSPGGFLVERGPGFNFTSQGRLKSIEFYGQDNDRETIPYRNCRLKAQKLKSLNPPPEDLTAFLKAIGKVDKDPGDFMAANLMCYTFDSSPLWKPWREKYSR